MKVIKNSKYEPRYGVIITKTGCFCYRITTLNSFFPRGTIVGYTTGKFNPQATRNFKVKIQGELISIPADNEENVTQIAQRLEDDIESTIDDVIKEDFKYITTITIDTGLGELKNQLANQGDCDFIVSQSEEDWRYYKDKEDLLCHFNPLYPKRVFKIFMRSNIVCD